MRRATVLLVGGILMAVMVGVQGAAAHDARISRTATVQFQDLPGATGDRVFGQLSIGQKSQSSFPALAARCLAGQRVVIKHTLTAPGGGSAPPQVLGTATTDAQGAWEFSGYEANGLSVGKFDTFQIQVMKHPIGKKSHRHHHICLGANGFVTVLSS